MSNYFYPLFDETDSYYIYVGGRNQGKTIYTIRHYLKYLFGGTCEYQFDPQTMTHHYLIRNDDIEYIDIIITNECFVYEDINTRLYRMCEEYDAYMRYKYRDYIRKEKKDGL